MCWKQQHRPVMPLLCCRCIESVGSNVSAGSGSSPVKLTSCTVSSFPSHSLFCSDVSTISVSPVPAFPLFLLLCRPVLCVSTIIRRGAPLRSLSSWYPRSLYHLSCCTHSSNACLAVPFVLSICCVGDLSVRLSPVLMSPLV